MMAFFRDNGVRELVMVGKVPKTVLWKRPELVQLDPTALAALSGLADRRDDALLGAVAELLESHGFRVLGQAELAPSLFAAEGVLGSVAPTSDQLADVRFGWPIAKSIGALDVGQTVVVQGLAVLALEAVEGTDETVRRGCALGRPGATVIKVAKPAQDVPTIGPATLRTLAQGQAGTLAVESGRTVVLDREEVVALADAHGITLLGMPEGGALPALERDG